MASLFSEVAEVICSMVFNRGERSRRVCVKLMAQVLEEGFAPLPRRGVEYHAALSLARAKIVRIVEVPVCGLRLLRKVIVLNHDFVRSLYMAIRDAKPPPLCVEKSTR